MKALFQKIPRGWVLFYALLAAWLGTTAMHIPDGYLSPVSCALLFLLVLPFWARGLRVLHQTLDARAAPRVALAAAFSFVIMMFNVPLPGGTSGHAVGGALAAIVLGPEIASIAISVALLLQALFFGDGGLLSLGANCLNMAVVLPYASYAVYQIVARGADSHSRRRGFAAVLAGWVGLSAAALLAGVEFGLQPLLFHAADGAPLYAPYPLSVAIPAMLIPHMLVAGVVEGLVTALVLAYLRRSNPALLGQNAQGSSSWRPLWVGLGILALITPLGLLAPGTAWGEWGAAELTRLGVAAVPVGLARLSGIWAAPLRGYALPWLNQPGLGYIFSALLGIGLCAALVWGFSWLAGRAKSAHGQSSQDR